MCSEPPERRHLDYFKLAEQARQLLSRQGSRRCQRDFQFRKGASFLKAFYPAAVQPRSESPQSKKADIGQRRPSPELLRHLLVHFLLKLFPFFLRAFCKNPLTLAHQ